MLALLLSESASCPNEGWLHWFVLHDGVTLATWVLAVFALVPLYALIKVIRSKKRDDQFRTLQWLDSQFNSSAMLSARRETGKVMLTNDHHRNFNQFVPTPAWPIVNFFDRISFLWTRGRLDIGDIDVAYREYIFRIWADFEKHLTGKQLQGQYNHLVKLRDALQKVDGARHVDDLAAALDHVKAEFWRRESEL